MTYTVTVEEVSAADRKPRERKNCTHKGIVWKDGKRVSEHRTSRGAEAAKKDAESAARHYEKIDARDNRAAA